MGGVYSQEMQPGDEYEDGGRGEPDQGESRSHPGAGGDGGDGPGAQQGWSELESAETINGTVEMLLSLQSGQGRCCPVYIRGF